ncbi:serine protease [Streptomyces sp. NPDC001787]|uniref:trypsin-like serine peptidase n=1 Tax=Streptomyces sp. NPDC001787 TaxID=3154523 RepID=UPI003329317E
MARVLQDGRPVGVAFLIPDRLLLTCAHVVASTAGLPYDEALPDLLPVTLDFPLLPCRPEAAASVHFSVSVAGDNSGDVAVLQLIDELPPGAVPLRIVEADDLAGHRWQASGFPQYPGRGGSRDAGIWTRGTVEGREGTGWWQLTCDEEAPFPLTGGFSGAPVWDEEYSGVIGIVSPSGGRATPDRLRPRSAPGPPCPRLCGEGETAKIVPALGKPRLRSTAPTAITLRAVTVLLRKRSVVRFFERSCMSEPSSSLNE